MKPTEVVLLESALSIFSAKGYHSTRVSDIVQNSNLSQGTFYLYFTSKEDIFIRLVEAFLTDIVAEIEKLSAELALLEPSSRFKQMIQNGLRIFYEHQEVAKLTMNFKHETDQIKLACLRYDDAIREYIRANIQHFEPYISMTEEQLDMATFSMYAMIQHLAYEWFIVRKAGEGYIERLADVLIMMILQNK